MSEENVEIVKGFTRLFEAGDRDVWRHHFDPDVVWGTSASQMPAAGIYHGHEGVERFFQEWLGAWGDYELETLEYIDAGSSVVIVFRQSGTGQGSGIRAERDFYAITTSGIQRSFVTASTKPVRRPSKPPGCRSSCSGRKAPRRDW